MAQPKLEKVGKYEIVEVVGRGGMGVVYRAKDPAIGREVAIKMITASYAGDPELLGRFYREARSTGLLQHPNIVTVFDLGDEEGSPYLVMEFLDGEGLDKVITERRHLPLAEKINILTQVGNGLHYAHMRSVVHRDIKPANVVVLSDGTIKIVDFGIARIGSEKHTKTGQIVGSIQYMSPEQLNSAPVDARTDIWAAGVTLFELLAYELPFVGKDTGSTLLRILNDPPQPLPEVLSAGPG
jgi:serine/threonine protein kinase